MVTVGVKWLTYSVLSKFCVQFILDWYAYSESYARKYTESHARKNTPNFVEVPNPAEDAVQICSRPRSWSTRLFCLPSRRQTREIPTNVLNMHTLLCMQYLHQTKLSYLRIAVSFSRQVVYMHTIMLTIAAVIS